MDLLQHVYFATYPHWPLAQAVGTLRQVNARLEGTGPELMTRLLLARRCLRELDDMLSVLPRVK